MFILLPNNSNEYNEMFFARICGIQEIFSSVFNAERAASVFLFRLNETAGMTLPYKQKFDEAFAREDYHGCMDIWNTYCASVSGSDRSDSFSRFAAFTVGKAELNKPFSYSE